MKKGLDTNVLIYAHIPELPQHAVVRRFLLAELEREAVTLVVTPGILHEFVHVVTDGRRFDPPVSMTEALGVARGYLGRANIECLNIDERSILTAFDLLERHRLGRRRMADSLFAATLLNEGVRELITCNLDDFRIFDELTLIDPRVES